MANKFRGEVALSANGQEVTMRLTLSALVGLEEKLGTTSLVALVEAFETGRFKARELCLLLWAGINGGGTEMSVAEVGALVIDGGPLEAARAGARLLAVTFSVDPE